MYELLDPEAKGQRVRSYGLQILHHLLSVDVVLCVSLDLCPRYCTTEYYSYTGKDTSRLRFMDSVAGHQDKKLRWQTRRRLLVGKR